MEEACRNEIERLHAFFVQWFTGAISKEEFSDAVFSENMCRIDPFGTMVNRSQLIQTLLRHTPVMKDDSFPLRFAIHDLYGTKNKRVS